MVADRGLPRRQNVRSGMLTGMVSSTADPRRVRHDLDLTVVSDERGTATTAGRVVELVDGTWLLSLPVAGEVGTVAGDRHEGGRSAALLVLRAAGFGG